MSTKANPRIAIIGLGYVGLPLAVEFGKQLATVGYDIDAARIEHLRRGFDATLEISAEELAAANQLTLSDDTRDLAECDVYIITVPTPIDDSKQPDLSPLRRASALAFRNRSPTPCRA